ncbi:type II toxin-antitoxin system RelB/DinJ family antitoxin [Pseudomonas sp. NUPR-001]|uniref:type II toxin-antitoxin system RelB/DinJ family antitoxin n=1 Tax=Pseudomonas sp. NUPR-001 TaxID=3416058 RepID=UPI003F9B313C
MVSINVCIHEALKACAYRVLEKQGVTPSELMLQVLISGAERGKLPLKQRMLTEQTRLCRQQCTNGFLLCRSGSRRRAVPTL